MDEEKDITPDTLADDVDVASPDGGDGAVDDKVEETKQESVKDILNQALGKDFKDDDTALKAVKDTFGYVGKKKEQIAEEIKSNNTNEDFVSKDQYNEDMFYSKNEQYAEFKDVLNALAKSDGKSLQEVADSDTFKGMYEKVNGFNKSQKVKNVLESNPRLGTATNKMDQARKAMADGDPKGAVANAASAVLDAYELQ